MKKLIQISAFWKNDKPNGIGLTLTDDLPLDSILQEIQTNYDLMWRQSVIESETATLVRDLFAQLEFIGKNKKPLGMELALMALGNIWLLENFGFIKPDEFNGLFLAHISDSKP